MNLLGGLGNIFYFVKIFYIYVYITCFAVQMREKYNQES